MNEDVVGKSILNPKGEAVQERICTVSFAGIHVMSREHDSFSQEPVIEHQQCAIKQFKFVIPEYMEDFRPAFGGIVEELRVVSQHSDGLFTKAGVWPQVTSKVEKLQASLISQFVAIQFIAAHQVDGRAMGPQ
jgi:hypothetical protein